MELLKQSKPLFFSEGYLPTVIKGTNNLKGLLFAGQSTINKEAMTTQLKGLLFGGLPIVSNM